MLPDIFLDEEFHEELEQLLPFSLYDALCDDIRNSSGTSGECTVFAYPIGLFKKWKHSKVKKGRSTYTVGGITFRLDEFTSLDPCDSSNQLKPWDRYKKYYLKARNHKERTKVLCAEFAIWAMKYYDATGKLLWQMSPASITISHLTGGYVEVSAVVRYCCNRCCNCKYSCKVTATGRQLIWQ
jgi:hypothetical protein